MDYLRGLLSPPHFADEDDRRIAFALNIILWLTGAVVILFIIATLILPNSQYLSVAIELAILAVIGICLVLMQHGLPRLSAYIFTLSLWLLISTATLSNNEITSTGVSSLYTVILIAGILLGSGGSFLLAVLSTVGVIANIFLMSIARGEASPPPEAWMPGITVITNFILVAVVAWLGRRSVLSSIEAVQSSRSLLTHRSAQLQAAADIGTAAGSSKDLPTLVETITSVIADRFGFYHVSILTYDPDSKETLLSSISQGGKRVSSPPAIRAGNEKERSIIAHVARTRKPYLAVDVQTDPLYLHNPQFEQTRSELAIPIIAGDRLFGVLDVLNNQETPLGNDELNALLVLVNQIGTVIDNKRLLDSASRHLDELIALHAIAAAGTEAESEDEFLRRATQVVGKSLFPTNFGVLLLDDKQGLLTHHSSYTESRAKVSPPIPVGEGITGIVALTGEAMRVADVSVEPKYISVDRRVRSELCVPLKSGDKVLGVLDVESHTIDSFSKADEHLLMALAGQIATSLERIRLFAGAQQRADELANTIKQQEELARLRDEFIQNVSHEFRTPLSIVGGYTEILDSGEFGPLPDAYRQPVSIIAKRVRLLSKLVEDLTSLLDLQAQRGDFRPLQLGEILQNMYAGYRTRALAERIELNLEIDNGVPAIRGEETLLCKAVDNLVDNAIKFTPPDGKIEIRVKSENSSVLLEVSDTGIGVPRDQQERIFERFYQVDGSPTRSFGGTGLGLALVKEIVELHGGQISVDSEADKGTVFKIELPALN
ncbi:MAG: GAF domain-containing protein [Anaerolineales bacterium]